jgi:hypothetical protein
MLLLGTSITFNNFGTITNTSSSGTISVFTTLFQGYLGSNINIGSGATLTFAPASVSEFAGNSTITGAGTVNINTAIFRSVGTNVSFGTGLTVNFFNNSIIEGAGDVTINSGCTFNWTSGTMRASGSTINHGTLNMNGGGNTMVLSDNRTLVNNGNLNWSTTGNIVFNGTGGITINNAGQFSITNTAAMFDNSSGNTLILNNTGTLTKNSPNNTTIGDNVTINNTGQINVNNGTLNISNPTGLRGGTFNISGSGELTGAAINFTGTTFTNNRFVTTEEVNFTGTSPQTLAGGGLMQTLRISNAFGVTLTGNQTVYYYLHFINGKLNTVTFRLKLSEGVTVTGANSSSYINIY